MSTPAPPPGGATPLAGPEPPGSALPAFPNAAPAAGSIGAGPQGSRPKTLLGSYAALPSWAVDVQASQTSQGKQVNSIAAGCHCGRDPTPARVCGQRRGATATADSADMFVSV